MCRICLRQINFDQLIGFVKSWLTKIFRIICNIKNYQ
ncbi:hypothetical protein E2I14_19005 [Sapientia aquatica]|uniref:Uncharacterized protein n=1 Tax=Sapientia aquatica TaxID=1549640 RepID=A0A4R5VLM8_9BURK|nr:hypothetical protein E2I14_19005 [Sapientia aquatica]